MSVIFYPRLSKYDLHLVRSPGPGLGNLLFPWVRALVRHAQDGGYLISPTWRNIKLGPWLRGEPDKRTYGDLFKHRPFAKFFQDLNAKLLPHNTLSEHQYYELISKGSYLFSTRTPTLVVFEGMADRFAGLGIYKPIIMETLTRECRVALPQAREHVAVHVRLGDFLVPHEKNDAYAVNTRLSLDYYISEIERLKKIYGRLPIMIYTDDPGDVFIKKLKSAAHASVVIPTNALVDILQMAQATHILLSNSTFSLWAAFLSKGTISCKFQELYKNYRLDDDEFISRII